MARIFNLLVMALSGKKKKKKKNHHLAWLAVCMCVVCKGKLDVFDGVCCRKVLHSPSGVLKVAVFVRRLVVFYFCLYSIIFFQAYVLQLCFFFFSFTVLQLTVRKNI